MQIQVLNASTSREIDDAFATFLHQRPDASDGTYIIEFRMADGESLAISVPAGETRVLKHFQARMPYGLVMPDVP